MSMKSRITFSTPNGDWGIEGVDLTKLSSKLYGAVMKLKKYEDSGLDPYEVEELQEKAKEVDKLYLEKCQEVNRLAAELAEYKRLREGELESAVN